MRVLLDNELCEIEADTVTAAVTQAATLAQQCGRLIVEVVVDGRTWNSEDLEGSARDAAAADEVRLTTADPVELVCQTLDDAGAALMDAERLQTSAAEQIQAGRIASGMTALNQAFGIWSSVQQAVTMGCELASVDLDQFRIDSVNPEESARVIMHKLNNKLREVRDALANQDTVALSDALLYELPAAVRCWRELIDDVRLHILENRSGAVGGSNS
jgi:hypothetical protein